MSKGITRRMLLGKMATGAAVVAAGVAGMGVARKAKGDDLSFDLLSPGAPADGGLECVDAVELRRLTNRLNNAPHPRSFAEVPMVLTNRSQWDAEAIDILKSYPGASVVYDAGDLFSPWLNIVRNNLNAMTVSLKDQNFLATVATHGSAQFALYDEYIWRKYHVADFLRSRIAAAKKMRGVRNPFLHQPIKAHDQPTLSDVEMEQGPYSPHDNSVHALQRRGAVFLACHNAVWEQAMALRDTGHNPDRKSHQAVAAELTNHLIPGVILTPGVLCTTFELQRSGFQYQKL